MGAYDMQQPREVTAGYFIRAEQMNDFIDYLFDIEQIGDYEELWNRFEQWEEQQFNKK